MIQKSALPIDYNVIRAALVTAVQQSTSLLLIEEMPETQQAQRPPKPYFSYSIISPAAKYGYDDVRFDSVSGTKVLYNRGGNRRMTVSFHCYSINKDDAYNYMSLWQSFLESEAVTNTLSKSGIAVWMPGTVADNSALLNTGYEGRSQMDVQFGIVFNVLEDLGAIETVETVGTVLDDGNVLITDTLSVQQGEE